MNVNEMGSHECERDGIPWMWTRWDPIEFYFYCTLILILTGLKMAV